MQTEASIPDSRSETPSVRPANRRNRYIRAKSEPNLAKSRVSPQPEIDRTASSGSVEVASERDDARKNQVLSHPLVGRTAFSKVVLPALFCGAHALRRRAKACLRDSREATSSAAVQRTTGMLQRRTRAPERFARNPPSPYPSPPGTGARGQETVTLIERFAYSLPSPLYSTGTLDGECAGVVGSSGVGCCGW